ncbi:hypothetical protein ACO22_02395 [Paracoccidioides brasiliensis]|uniref:SGNH hydrolase-type esterase domain-containing protein n=1 Tax=Paracoccidioides brasiliensis TaxID=121759 RepID=A0A1D2JIV9_PARBR|nr:hypothetical protein ACO22_02395 [Paracoccidioides brasiliensis]
MVASNAIGLHSNIPVAHLVSPLLTTCMMAPGPRLAFALGLGTWALSVHAHSAWNLRVMESLVAFGDSYTDESRLRYFIEHKERPPVGWIAPETRITSSGGTVWARYASRYTGAQLYNYAVSGAVCSNDITPRFFGPTNSTFPSVEQYEIPAFMADASFQDPATGIPFLNLPRRETVYAIWIGTNDLGNGAFMTDSQAAGTTLPDYVECVFRSLDRLYDHGGRYFVLMNLAPLDLLPLYALPERGGVRRPPFCPNKPENITEISYRMKQAVVAVNEIMKLKVEISMWHRYRGAGIALFDTHSLLSDMYFNPRRYLNGTKPPDIQGWIRHCDHRGQNCDDQPSPDSYMWYDELHPSEQTGRILAQHFVEVVKGTSAFATYFS